MAERRSTLAEVAERMRVSPRWLRDRVNRMPVKVGDRFGRLWTFTASQEHDLAYHLRGEEPSREPEPEPVVIPPEPPKAKAYPGPWRHNKSLVSHPDGVIYFIRAGAFVKIGTAIDVERRFRQLQIAHPEPLDLIFSMPGGGVEETDLHSRFREHRVRGEWFRLAPEIEEFIAAKETT